MKAYWLEGEAYRHTYACNKIYKRSLFKNIRFPIGKLFEDVYTLPQLLRIATTIATTDVGCYHYCYNPNGITAQADGNALAQLLQAHLQSGMPIDDNYYLHLANIQSDVWERTKYLRNPSLQMISFTITEKGYGFNEADLARGLQPVFAMGKVCALLYERFNAGKLPLTVQSMDNCSHNGDKVKAGVFAYAERWAKDGLVPADFIDYLKDETKITFPWSMIDKITPRPHEKVKEMLAADGFEDNNYIETEKHTFTAPFVNAEEVQYLVIEDNYTNGRPPLDLGGALYTTRETVDKVETMKVTTCLNPLHTAMSIYGCMLGYTLISAEMKDEDLRAFIQKIGYMEAMPVVTDPGVLNPYEFIGDVLNKRLPNPFMPDAPQRIAMDTSQKLPIRFGETLKKYIARGLDKRNLVLIPLTLAGYARYLKGVKDDGTAFEPSPDPMLAELQAIVAPLEIGKEDQDYSCLKQLYTRKDVFGLDLYEAGLGEQIEGMVKELYAGKGAVRQTLHKYVVAR